MRGLEWMDQALCTEVGTEIFFPATGEPPREAKSVCARCHVQSECLEYALQHGMVHGVWGGMTEHERRRFRRRGVA